MQTPVLLIIFNRPDKVQRQLQVLRQARPKQLYVAADGPRSDVPSDEAKCAKARQILEEGVDWECTLIKNFRTENFGVDNNCEKGITWFFEHVSEGIILEDDCIAHPDFFTFAKNLLEKYRAREDIMMICGTNWQNGNWRGDGSYYLSRLVKVWGWASWRRAWQKYDSKLKGMEQFFTEEKSKMVFATEQMRVYFQNAFLEQYHKKGTRMTWDMKWRLAILKNYGYTIYPNANLVQNIGYGKDATHTAGRGTGWSVAHAPLGDMAHPSRLEWHQTADVYQFRHHIRKTWWDRLYNDANVLLDALKIKPFLLRAQKSFAKTLSKI